MPEADVLEKPKPGEKTDPPSTVDDLRAMLPDLAEMQFPQEEPTSTKDEKRVIFRNPEAPRGTDAQEQTKDEPQGIVLSRDQQLAEGLLLTPEVLKYQGKRLFKELGKLTDKDRSIHRRMTKMWTSLTNRRTPDADQKLLWTQTQDVRYPHFAVEVPEGGEGDPVISEVPDAGNGDIVIEGYGDKTKNHVESYVVQLNRIKGNRDRPYKMRIAPSGISLLTRNEETQTFEPDPNFPPRLLTELQETITQLRTGKIPEIKHRPNHQLFEEQAERLFNEQAQTKPE